VFRRAQRSERSNAANVSPVVGLAAHWRVSSFDIIAAIGRLNDRLEITGELVQQPVRAVGPAVGAVFLIQKEPAFRIGEFGHAGLTFKLDTGQRY
jgi:hypothetical protein